MFEILREVTSPSGKIWEKSRDFWEKWDLVIQATLKKELHQESAEKILDQTIGQVGLCWGGGGGGGGGAK